MAAFVISSAESELFLRLSGDRNPIHWDEVAARRLMFGRVVVHGIHTVLRAVDAWLAASDPKDGSVFHLSRLSATLKQPLFVGEVAGVSFRIRNSRHLVQVAIGGTVLAAVGITGEWTRSASTWAQPLDDRMDEPVLDLNADDIEGMAGWLAPHGDTAAERSLFPAVFRCVGAGVAARIAAVSRLVGCRCPGLHSLMADFDIELDPATGSAPLAYRVTGMDRRFQLVSLEVSGHGLAGTVSSMLRPAPTAQKPVSALADAALDGRAAGHRPLILGGSRGLGELTAKIVAAAGGEPTITYLKGEAEALRVQADIRAAGFRCHIARLDILSPPEQWEAALPAGWQPNALYYFATPRIFTRRIEMFSYPLFLEYAAYYVDGFARACALLVSCCNSGPASVFYPSSTALDERVRGLPEYAMAKAAGETLCGALAAARPNWTFVQRRLPRLVTDQTALIAPTVQLGTEDVMDSAAIVREVMVAMLPASVD
jgi:acyl dehydratase